MTGVLPRVVSSRPRGVVSSRGDASRTSARAFGRAEGRGESFEEFGRNLVNDLAAADSRAKPRSVV